MQRQRLWSLASLWVRPGGREDWDCWLATGQLNLLTAEVKATKGDDGVDYSGDFPSSSDSNCTNNQKMFGAFNLIASTFRPIRLFGCDFN